ncbi:MAG TPA: YceK/YidQ family lipoprotein [Spongiibacteraceae bacterium]|nr:YceK/YidQ family lipoprotein [Spongiibacteraceae bacterium]
MRSNLVRNKTRCETVSHIYSGVAYDFCRLNSINDGVADDLYGSVLLGFFISDMAPSLVVDTLALPYTGYQEHRLGSIAIRGD